MIFHLIGRPSDEYIAKMYPLIKSSIKVHDVSIEQIPKESDLLSKLPEIASYESRLTFKFHFFVYSFIIIQFILKIYCSYLISSLCILFHLSLFFKYFLFIMCEYRMLSEWVNINEFTKYTYSQWNDAYSCVCKQTSWM